MNKNVHIEAEGNELILKNSAGDHVIIPKKYRREVEDMIKEGCFGCIDNLVSTLPVMSNYAEDGTIIEGDKEKKPETNGNIHVLVESPILNYMEEDSYFDEYTKYLEKQIYGASKDDLLSELADPKITQERKDEINNLLDNSVPKFQEKFTLDEYNKYLKEKGIRPYVEGETRSEFFNREAERLKKNLPNVNITYTYNNPQEVDSVFSSVKPNDKIVIMGHAGGRTLGIPNKDIAKSLRTNIKEKDGVECLLGGCHSSDLLEDYKYASIPVHGYTGESWYVPYDKGTDLYEMMFGWKYEYDENSSINKTVKKVPASEMMKTIKPF